MNGRSYACRDDKCHLRPLGPGQRRVDVYCPGCRATLCLFCDLTPQERIAHVREQDERLAARFEGRRHGHLLGVLGLYDWFLGL